MMAHWLLLHPDMLDWVIGPIVAWVTFVYKVYEPDDIRRLATEIALVVLVGALLAVGTILTRSSLPELGIVFGGLFVVLLACTYRHFRAAMIRSAKSARQHNLQLAPMRSSEVWRFGDQDVIIEPDQIFVRTRQSGAALKFLFRIALGLVFLSVLGIFHVASGAPILICWAFGTAIGGFVKAQRFRCLMRVSGRKVYYIREEFCSLRDATIAVTPFFDDVQVCLCKASQRNASRLLVVVPNEEIAAEFAVLMREFIERCRGQRAWPPAPNHVLFNT